LNREISNIFAGFSASNSMCSPSTIDIGPMTPADIPAVLEIEQASQLEPWSKESFIEELQRIGSHVFVARMPTESMDAVGYVCMWIVADEIQILNLAVSKTLRRRGIGRSLLLHALRFGWKKNARVVALEVRRSNTAARTLYGSLGFREVGRRPGYYGGEKEAAILMVLELDDRWRAFWLDAQDGKAL
jgi:ribosomal-protein-alanine N-acetyltransferase